MSTTRDTFTLVYRPRGRYVHLENNMSCPVVLRFCEEGHEAWLGTGTQEEYEIAARGELCPHCKKRMERYR